jgi:predicted O-methyltransferase YrrM
MDMRDPHRVLEPPESERATVAEALSELEKHGLLRGTNYPEDRFVAFRDAVRREFEIPWTAITPRMQRLLFAVSAIHRPETTVAVGVFCGFTFACAAGACAGPGCCHDARRALGIEIVPEHAALAQRNLARLDPSGVLQIQAADGIEILRHWEGTIDLLYLDATGDGHSGKGIYLDLLETAWPRLPSGALVLAHNSHNAADSLGPYLEQVRDPGRFRESVNVVLDPEGLEVSVVA